MESSNRSATTAVAAILVAAGMALAGWFVGHGFVTGRTAADRFVTVKGVAERPVEADVALWPIAFTVAGNDLAATQATLGQHEEVVLVFLAGRGIARDGVRVQSLRVHDQAANPWQQGDFANRFILTETLMVRSEEPEKVERAAQEVSRLVAAGVVLASDMPFGTGPTYLFKSLNEHKPEMIAEATAGAREAAEQFAEDSGGRLGGIRRASQGVFVVLPRDQAGGISEESERLKTLRVVTTIEYYLAD